MRRRGGEELRVELVRSEMFVGGIHITVNQ